MENCRKIMGGCSSKPKTAEFEGAMDMQEEKLQDEAVQKSAEVERIYVDAGLKCINKEQECPEVGIQNHIVEEGDDLHYMLAETRKHMNAGFDSEGEYNGERHMLEGDHKCMKEACKDGINENSFSEQQTAIKENSSELENGLKNSVPATSEVHEGQILIDVGTTEHQQTPMISNIGTYFMHSLAECETQAVEKHPSHDNGDPHLHEETITLHDDYMNLGKHIYFEAERSFVLLDSAGLELQKDPSEEAEKREVNLEPMEAGNGNEGVMLVASPRQKNQIGTVEVEPQDVSEGARKGAVEMESQEVHENGVQRLVNNLRQKDQIEERKECHIAVNGACLPDIHSKEIEKEVLGEKSFLFGKDMSAKDEVIDAATLDVTANGQQSLALKCSCSRDGVCEELMQARVMHGAASTCAFARSSAKWQAEPTSKRLLSVDNGLQKESTGEVVSDESWYILEKVNVTNNQLSAVVLKEHIPMELQKNGDGVPSESSMAVVEEVVLSEDPAGYSKVTTANREKPEARFIHVLDPVGFAFKNIPAQEMYAPDIDDVLEKLASEFERQESLSRSNS